MSDGAQPMFMRLIDDGLADLRGHSRRQVAELIVDPQLDEVDTLGHLLVDGAPRFRRVRDSLIEPGDSAIGAFENQSLTGGVYARHLRLCFALIGTQSEDLILVGAEHLHGRHAVSSIDAQLLLHADRANKT